MPFTHTSVPATPGRIPGINRSTRTIKEKRLLRTARMNSAKMSGGTIAFTRSVTNKINMFSVEFQKMVFFNTSTKF